jgi:RHH-type proline utilization regulon transcriptional repressor/proline dehydrogenase/delta 1-pyrroline-5-carboxylate dehydrogenase
MLHGMADAVKAALVQLDLRVREYCPIGELLPGIAHWCGDSSNVSNEGFLASKFARTV